MTAEGFTGQNAAQWNCTIWHTFTNSGVRLYKAACKGASMFLGLVDPFLRHCSKRLVWL